jgi:hypothetical protein
MSPHHVRRLDDVEEHIPPGIVDSGENWTLKKPRDTRHRNR